MVNEKENKQFRMDSWLLKQLSRSMKTKQKNNQPTNNHKK